MMSGWLTFRLIVAGFLSPRRPGSCLGRQYLPVGSFYLVDPDQIELSAAIFAGLDLCRGMLMRQYMPVRQKVPLRPAKRTGFFPATRAGRKLRCADMAAKLSGYGFRFRFRGGRVLDPFGNLLIKYS